MDALQNYEMGMDVLQNYEKIQSRVIVPLNVAPFWN